MHDGVKLLLSVFSHPKCVCSLLLQYGFTIPLLLPKRSAKFLPIYLQTRSDLSSLVLVISLVTPLYSEQFMFSESAGTPVFYHQWYEEVYFYFQNGAKSRALGITYPRYSNKG